MVVEWNSFNLAHMGTNKCKFLISNFCRVLNIVCFLLGNSLAYEFYMPTFRNTLFHLHRQVGMKVPSYLPVSLYLPACEDGTDSVPKCRHIKFRHWGITQKKVYNRCQIIQHSALPNDTFTFHSSNR